jgi:hypothetical protein
LLDVEGRAVAGDHEDVPLVGIERHQLADEVGPRGDELLLPSGDEVGVVGDEAGLGRTTYCPADLHKRTITSRSDDLRRRRLRSAQGGTLKSHSMRTIVSAATLIIATLGFTSTAGADAPTRVPADQHSTRYDGLCSFPVTVDILVNKEYKTTFASGQIAGQDLYTGALKVRVTNVTTGEAVDLNVSGPIQVIPNDDSTTVISLGPTLWAFTDPQPGLPPLALVSGRLEAIFDPDFRVTSVDAHVVDLCALLS